MPPTSLGGWGLRLQKGFHKWWTSSQKHLAIIHSKTKYVQATTYMTYKVQRYLAFERSDHVTLLIQSATAQKRTSSCGRYTTICCIISIARNQKLLFFVVGYSLTPPTTPLPCKRLSQTTASDLYTWEWMYLIHTWDQRDSQLLPVSCSSTAYILCYIFSQGILYNVFLIFAHLCWFGVLRFWFRACGVGPSGFFGLGLSI